MGPGRVSTSTRPSVRDHQKHAQLPIDDVDRCTTGFPNVVSDQALEMGCNFAIEMLVDVRDDDDAQLDGQSSPMMRKFPAGRPLTSIATLYTV